MFISEFYSSNLDEKLTDILGQPKISEAPKQTKNTKDSSDHNNSTQSEPSPPFECIAEKECANTSDYSMKTVFNQLNSCTHSLYLLSDQMPDLTSDSLQLQDSNENMANSTAIAAPAAAKKPYSSTNKPNGVYIFAIENPFSIYIKTIFFI